MAVPARAGTQITLSLSAPAALEARVLNLAGRSIRTVCQARPCAAGTNTLLWDRRSDAGLLVPAGSYLVEVTARAATGLQTRSVAIVSVRR